MLTYNISNVNQKKYHPNSPWLIIGFWFVYLFCFVFERHSPFIIKISKDLGTWLHAIVTALVTG